MRERIAIDELWRVAHAVGTQLPGWLDLPVERRGPGVFELLGAPEQQRVDGIRMDALAAALGEELRSPR